MKMLILLTSLMLSVSSFAQQGGGNNPCKADAQKFCANVEGDKGHKGKCLREHEKDLSPGCAKKLAAGKAKIEAETKAENKAKAKK